MNITGIGNVNWPDLLTASVTQTPSHNNPGPSAGTLTESVSLSSAGQPAGGASLPGVSVDAAGHMVVNIDGTLTAGDKALVTAATGGLDLVGPNGVHEVNQLAVTIALDRAMGNLTGPITASYLNNLKTSEQASLALNQQPGNAMAPWISFDVLDKALAYLGQQPTNPPAV